MQACRFGHFDLTPHDVAFGEVVATKIARNSRLNVSVEPRHRAGQLSPFRKAFSPLPVIDFDRVKLG